MRRLGSLLLFLFICFFSANSLQAQFPMRPPNVNPVNPYSLHKPPALQSVPLLRRAETAILPAFAAKNIVPVLCSSNAQAFGANLCGYVNVPLDREHPTLGTIPIYFELYLHPGSAAAESAILVNHGGPGLTTTGFRGFWLSVFGPNLDVHDLLLIDDRGRGLSGTIVCSDLQYGNAAYVPGIEECAAQLANSASRYGTGDIAEDTEAVRAALGYEKLDYYGTSYGGADVTAYATRFGKHLRSIVLDAPFGTPMADDSRFVAEQYRTHHEPRMVSLDCQRSPTCSPDHPFPRAELNALISTVRFRPVEGDAYNANGNLVHVRMDENALLNYVIDNPTGLFSSTGEILAAARSLWEGDSRPLLRLGAEGYFPVDYSNAGDPTFFSYGANMATFCADLNQPFDWFDPVSERTEQYTEAVSDLPPWYFTPFSKVVSTGEIFSFVWGCQYWQRPTPSLPIAPPYPLYPLAPTLVLTGDLDSRVPFDEVTKVAALFPNSTLVSVAEAGHVSVSWTHCAANLASEFIEKAQVPDTSCASTPETVWPAVGRFPWLAKHARPAVVQPGGGNQIGLAERQVATVAVATATDALQRSIIGSGTGVGLRAGTFHTVYGSSWTITLTDCVFATDVTVNGTVIWNADNSFEAELTVSGPGTSGGTLSVKGGYIVFGGPLGNFTVTGTLGGKQVAVLVPEA